VSSETNNALLALQPNEQGWERVDTGAILATIGRELRSEAEPTRLEALRWVHFLLHRAQAQVGVPGPGMGALKWGHLLEWVHFLPHCAQAQVSPCDSVTAFPSCWRTFGSLLRALSMLPPAPRPGGGGRSGGWMRTGALCP
jgi:hypothetical protein